jgi:predicted phage terminase large subunit-like protein
LEKEYLNQLASEAPHSLSAFVEFMTPDEPPAAHHEFMCDTLEAMERRDEMRVALSFHPGAAKTKFCSRYFPAWYLGRNQGHKYLQGGHSQAFAENEFGKYVRDIISDDRFRQVFPDVSLHPRSTAAGNWRLRLSRGGYVTKGVGQKLAGYRGHAGGVDDPFGTREDAESEVIRKKVKDWFFADFRTRFLPNSPIFIVATRWHEEDLIGQVEILNKQGRGMPWHIININALIENEQEAAEDPLGRDVGEAMWAEYYNSETLLDLKATLPDRDWFALYKGKPRNEEGNVVKLSWFRRYQALPRNLLGPDGRVIKRNCKRISLSVDCANKKNDRANYTVVGVWMEDFEGRHYLAHVERKKVEYVELKKLIEDTAIAWQANQILVEDKGNGTSYIQERQGKAPAPIVAIQPEAGGDKEFRFDAVTPMIEGGEVLLPEQASWLAEYENELLSFPNGANDDQVDMTSQYLSRVRKKRKYGSQKLRGAGIRAAA